jgi:hypothetical protein
MNYHDHYDPIPKRTISKRRRRVLAAAALLGMDERAFRLLASTPLARRRA